jgi:hypothetical protein
MAGRELIDIALHVKELLDHSEKCRGCRDTAPPLPDGEAIEPFLPLD